MDYLKVVCPKCSAPYKLPAAKQGKRLRCLKCRTVFRGVAEEVSSASSLEMQHTAMVEDTDTLVATAQRSPSSEGSAKFPEAPRVNDVVGDCHIMAKLGEGGMGVVYKAVRRSLKRLVALKLLPKSIADRNASYAKRFITEAQSAASLYHPNIVTVYNVGVDGDNRYIEMEFVQGQSLGDVLKGGRLSLTEAIRIVRSAAEALGYAHDHGIVHRDIKPDNIMLTDDGTVKVSDFGLAGSMYDPGEAGVAADGRGVARKKGTILGTPSYMSPQQCRGEVVDHRTDIYALGITFYIMLAGRAPFKHKDPLMVLQMHQRNPVPDIREKNPNVPEAVWNVMLKMLAKKLDDRYQTCAELLDDLDAATGKGGTGGPGGAGTDQEFWGNFAALLGGPKKG